MRDALEDALAWGGQRGGSIDGMAYAASTGR